MSISRRNLLAGLAVAPAAVKAAEAAPLPPLNMPGGDRWLAAAPFERTIISLGDMSDTKIQMDEPEAYHLGWPRPVQSGWKA